MSDRLVSTLDPSDLPDIYAMGLSGDCMLPVLKDGCFAKFSKSEPYKVGDLVVLYRRPEIVPPGSFQGIVKRIVMMPPPWVTFPFRENPKSEVRALVVAEQLNPPRTYAIACEDLLGIHKCIGECQPGEVRVRMSDDEIRALKRGKA